MMMVENKINKEDSIDVINAKLRTVEEYKNLDNTQIAQVFREIGLNINFDIYKIHNRQIERRIK